MKRLFFILLIGIAGAAWAVPDFGHWPASSTVIMPWNTNGADGASITRSTNGTIKIFKNGSATERASANGVTDNEDFDSATGAHLLTIDTSDNSDAGFYAAGSVYTVAITGATVDTKTVNAFIGQFRLGPAPVNAIQVGGTAQTGGDLPALVQALPTPIPTPDVSALALEASVQALPTPIPTPDISALALEASVQALPTPIPTPDISGLATSAEVAAIPTPIPTPDISGLATPEDIPAAADVAAAVWDALTSGLSAAGSIGKQIADNLDAAVSTRLATTGYTAPPTVAEILAGMVDGTVDVKGALKRLLAAVFNSASVTGSTDKVIQLKTSAGSDFARQTIAADGTGRTTTVP